jgi:hypothetical protein
MRILAAAAVAAAHAAAVFACSGDAQPDTAADVDAGIPRRDGGPVDPIEGGKTADAGTTGPTPSCSRYCDLVDESCTGEHAQYASTDECLAFCAHLPSGKAGDEAAPSLACRQYYAGNPARTDPMQYCLASGPFGGGLCGDRCEAFCELTLSACGTGAAAPYEKRSDCATACAGFAFLEPGVDGGGETPDGPDEGNTLNCRLFHLREAMRAPAEACPELAADSGACR